MSLIEDYLEGYSEPEAKVACEFSAVDRAVVIPALYESALLPDALATLGNAAKAARLKAGVIIVVNAQESHHDTWKTDNLKLLEFLTSYEDPHLSLCIVDRTAPGRELPPKSGVGLARKIGCDIAVRWFSKGILKSPWIHTTDADARVDLDYFSVIPETKKASAFVYHYSHLKFADSKPSVFLYELHLRHYVAGLQFAGSPYAFNTIGSLIAFHAGAYAAVRGFPKREAGEDFYFLNKLRKVGTVRELKNRPIQLIPRNDVRVPFGTTKSQVTIDEALRMGEPFALYDPRIFRELRQLLQAQERFVLSRTKVDHLSAISEAAWSDLEGPAAMEQALLTRKTESSLRRHVQDWFDGFRTLKYVHYLTEKSYPKLPWEEALDLFEEMRRRDRSEDSLSHAT